MVTKMITKSPSRVAGMTLIEMILTMGIVMVLTLTLFWMLVAGKKMHQSSLTRTADRQDLEAVLGRMAEDMEISNINSITSLYIPSGVPTPADLPRIRAVSFLSAYSDDGDSQKEPYFHTDQNGIPLWQKYVIYYVPLNSTKLVRKEVKLAVPSTAITTLDPTPYLTGGGHLETSALEVTSDKSKLPSLYLGFDRIRNCALLSASVKNQSVSGTVDEQSKVLQVSMFN